MPRLSHSFPLIFSSSYLLQQVKWASLQHWSTDTHRSPYELCLGLVTNKYTSHDIAAPQRH